MKTYVKTGAWLTNNYTTIDELMKMSQDQLVEKLHPYDMEGSIEGWTLVGEAHVFIKLNTSDEMIANKVCALKAELNKTQAEAEAKCNLLRGQINNLLAIEYKHEEAA
jgi:hypothetical protein